MHKIIIKYGIHEEVAGGESIWVFYKLICEYVVDKCVTK